MIHKINGRVVTEAEWAKRSKFHEIIESGHAPAAYMDQDWRNENNGLGRQIHQLSDYDQKTYAKSPKDAAEKARRRGKKVEMA